MTAKISVEATGGGFAAGRDQTINFAPSPDLVAALMRPLEQVNEKQRKEIGDLRDRLGTSDGILNRVAGILMEHLEQGEIGFDRIPQLLIELVKRRQAAIEQERTRPQDPDSAFAELQKKLEEALAAGDDEQARQLYEQKREAKLAARKKRLKTAERLREAATRDLLDAAESEAGLGELAYGRLEYRRAAEHFRGAAELLSEDDEHASLRLGYLDRSAEALYRQGDEFGENNALADAIDRCRALLDGRPRDRIPLDWAMTQDNLGTALSTLGEREGNTALLKQAVEAFNEALKELTREREPLQWVTTQNNLGVALAALGERERSTASLEKAVEAFREALKVPLQWATTQTNLGTALMRLGERNSDTVLLKQAVEAFNEALKEWTREREPFQWAMAQNNLGGALFRLGERERSTKSLEGAVKAFREALQVRTRERVPLQWAKTQKNLGGALFRLGERAGDRVKFAEARRAIEGAFEIFMQVGQEQHRGYFEDLLQTIDRQMAALTPPR